MTNCIKHSNNNRFILFLFIAVLFAGCSEEKKKDDFVARVNDAILTEAELATMIDTSTTTKVDRELVIRDWINRELLFQKAKEEGIVDQDDYKNILKSSEQQLAAALLLKDFTASEEIKLSDADLMEYYEKNQHYFNLNLDSYLINEISFRNEDAAIKFRTLAIESDWGKAVNLFSSDTSLIRILNAELLKENELYPKEFSRIAKDLYPHEISLVITEKAGYYSVAQLIAKYPKDSTPPFDVVKGIVEDRYKAELRKMLIDNYIKEIYSQNEIEIKQ